MPGGSNGAMLGLYSTGKQVQYVPASPAPTVCFREGPCHSASTSTHLSVSVVDVIIRRQESIACR